MANKIRILTDSASDLTREQLQAEDVGLAPLTVQCGDDTLVDDKTFSMQTLWEKMKNGAFIKTSQPSPTTFLELFEDAKRAGDDVICITISSELSGTFQTAMLAKSMAAYDRIFIVDSRCAAAAEKLLVFRACQLRRQGILSAAQIAAELESFRGRIRLFACINTLEYLVRGGRLSKTVGKLGTALNMKPIFTFAKDGNIDILRKALGLKKGLDLLCALLKSCPPDPAFPILPLFACDDSNCRAFLLRLSEQNTQIPWAEPEEIGATIGCHIGPGGFGIAYVAQEK